MTSKKQVAELLASVPLFSQCSKRTRLTVARHLETAELPAGQVVVTEGGPGDAFFVILDGEAVVAVGGRTVATLGEGEAFGELALLDGLPRSATVTATTDLTIAVLGARMFRTLLREYPALSNQLLTSLASQLREARELAYD